MTRRRLVVISAVALLASGLAYARSQSREARACAFCERAVCHGTSYRIRLSFGRTKNACCARCGIRYERQHAGSVHAAQVTDFATGNEIAARAAVYVEGSDFSHCAPGLIAHVRDGGCITKCFDRCLPSLVAFGDQRSAELFRGSHGGTLRTFDDLLQE